MDNYGKVIYGLLSSATSVINLVGMDSANVGPKIYPVTIPEGENYPCVVYTKSIEPEAYSKGADPFKTAKCIVSVYSIHTDLDVCAQIASAVEQVLGNISRLSMQGITVRSMRWLGREDELYEPKTDTYQIRSRFNLLAHYSN